MSRQYTYLHGVWSGVWKTDSTTYTPSQEKKLQRKCTKPTSTSGGTTGDTTSNKHSRMEHPEVDPLQPAPNMLPLGDDELTTTVQEVYQEHWSAIHTRQHTGHVQDIYNYRLRDMNLNSLVNQLQQLFRHQTRRFKVNVSFGFMLWNMETGELRYYHSSQNHGCLLDTLWLINGQEDFDAFLQDLVMEDILEWARQQWPNSKWTVLYVTNLTVCVNHLSDHPIGCDEVQLPDYIKKHKAIIGLEMNAKGNVS